MWYDNYWELRLFWCTIFTGTFSRRCSILDIFILTKFSFFSLLQGGSENLDGRILAKEEIHLGGRQDDELGACAFQGGAVADFEVIQSTCVLDKEE